MKIYKGPAIKIKVRSDGSLKGSVISTYNKKIAEITSKDRIFKMIERKTDNKNETYKVIHSAWGNNFYHEDIKYEKISPHRHSSNKKIDENKKLREKQSLRERIKEVYLKYKR